MATQKSSLPWFWIVFFGLVLLAFLLAVLVPRFFIRYQIDSMPPEVVAAVERFRSEPLGITEAMVRPRQAPEDLLALVESKRALLEDSPPPLQNSLLIRAASSEGLNEGEWLELASKLRSASAQMEAVVELVSHPDFHIGVFPLKESPTTGLDYSPMQVLARYLAIQSRDSGRKGDFSSAFAASETILRLSIRDRGSDLTGHLVAVALQLIYAQTIGTLARECGEVVILKQALLDLQSLKPRVMLDTFEDPILATVVSAIQTEIDGGGSIEFDERGTGSDYFAQILAPGSAFWRRSNAPQTSRGARLTQSVISFFNILWGTQDILFAQSLITFQETTIREQQANAALELAHLALASSIHKLETGAKSNDQSAFLLDLLKEPLLDPFSEKPYLWDPSSEVFYSVAPDGTDDGNQTPYAPTNGTKSAGDFSLR